jgi:hypothetical protein
VLSPVIGHPILNPSDESHAVNRVYDSPRKLSQSASNVPSHGGKVLRRGLSATMSNRFKVTKKTVLEDRVYSKPNVSTTAPTTPKKTRSRDELENEAVPMELSTPHDQNLSPMKKLKSTKSVRESIGELQEFTPVKSNNREGRIKNPTRVQ